MKKPVISKPEAVGTYKKVIVHGPSGAGKTRFASTWPNAIILDIEGGTMSIDKDKAVDIVAKDQITIASLPEYIEWLGSKEADQYETVVLDSLTELQSQFLNEKLKTVPDPRMAYGQWQAYLRSIMQELFNLKKHVVLIARSKMGEDIEGAEKLFPELSPSAFSVVPALVDYAIVITGETTGLGLRATTTTYGFGKHPKYWTKARSIIADKFEPSYEGFIGGIK